MQLLYNVMRNIYQNSYNSGEFWANNIRKIKIA